MAEIICGWCGQRVQVTHRRRRFCSRDCSNAATGQRLATRALDTGLPRKIVWSCGGGVDSTAVAVLIWQRELPPPDYALMIDVGYEPQTTWNYARDVLTPKLAEVGVKLTILRTRDYSDNELIKDGHVVIPAYRLQPDGTTSKLHTHCSSPWKARVAKRWLRAQGVKQCEQWLGIAADEQRRAVPDQHAWVRTRWPLIERGLTRADCIYLIGQAGWPMPERTSCYMCPHRSEGDWRRLVARSPQDFKRACEIEEAIQQTHPDVYLHRSGKPLRIAVNACPPAMDDAQRRSCATSFSACV